MSRSKGVSSSTLALNSNSKIGLVRFLQLNPQPKMVEVLLKAKYKKKVMTESERETQQRGDLESKTSTSKGSAPENLQLRMY